MNDEYFIGRMMARIQSMENVANMLVHHYPDDEEIAEGYKHIYEAVKLIRKRLLVYSAYNEPPTSPK